MAELDNACCSPQAQASCCEPDEKADCCGHGEGCGCAAGGDPSNLKQVRETVRTRYAAAARESGLRCSSNISLTDDRGSQVFGATLYEDDPADEGTAAAVGASLGCGVPTAVADLHPGETVLDLGSGAGADVLISARRVGPTGHAIGLDMTDEMLDVARANARAAGVQNVEFVKGYLEALPLPDASVDVVISNCVINLSGDKPAVLTEAGRVLRPGGRFAVSDVIADPNMDEATRADMAAWTGCIAGALTESEFREALASAGLQEIEIRETHRVHEHATAAIIRARKPNDRAAEPAAIPECKLDSAQLGSQLERYRRLGQHASTVQRLPAEVIVQFRDDLPPGLLERTLKVEQQCCPFVLADYDRDAQRLSLTVEKIDQAPRLESLFSALS